MVNDGKKVFIVEDDEDLVFLLEMLLEEEGYQVITSNYPDPTEVSTHDPDLLLVDLWFGERREGEYFVKDIHTQYNSHLPVILMSSDNEVAKIAQQLDTAGYVIKPFDVDNLLRKVQKVLQWATEGTGTLIGSGWWRW